MSLFLEAYWNLVVFDWYLKHPGFTSLYHRVRSCPVHQRPAGSGTSETISSAIAMASIWYWKEVPCLQRAAAMTCLLRRHGVRAEMVIGAQQTPFRAHAWVEIDGVVAGDRPYVREIYRVLARC